MCESGSENETTTTSRIARLKEARMGTLDLLLETIEKLTSARENMHGSIAWREPYVAILGPLVKTADFLDGEILIETHRTVDMTK